MRHPASVASAGPWGVVTRLLRAGLGLGLLAPTVLWAGLFAPKPAVVPKWSPFEHSFHSSVDYTNPLQQATLKVQFISPLGESSEVYGFWDGGKVWRVRFAPGQLGHWTFHTSCSDPANRGLDNQSGQFLCSASVGTNRFHEHGPVQVSRDRHHLEHADGTPFFWVADTTWNGAQASTPNDWDMYARIRSSQNFSVVEWAVAPGHDSQGQSAVGGFPERIAINLDFFRRLDAKLERLGQSGLLSAVAPLRELEDQGAAALPDDQAILLLRYAVARWGAEPVAWLLAFEGDTEGKQAGRWKRIGQAVFADIRHAPVVLDPGHSAWVLDEFRDQPWVDAVALQTVTDLSQDALKFTFAGPYAKEWTKEPARPLIAVTPCENGLVGRSGERFGSDLVRRAAYWGLLLAPPAGVSYSGQGVVDWDSTSEPREPHNPGSSLPLWEKALFMPAAKQMFLLSGLMSSVDFWRLRPEPKLVAAQPGDTAPERYIAAAATERRDLATVYVPQERIPELATDRVPASAALTWFNPRTGARAPAIAVVGTNCQVPTPEAGDWVLLLQTPSKSQ